RARRSIAAPPPRRCRIPENRRVRLGVPAFPDRSAQAVPRHRDADEPRRNPSPQGAPANGYFLDLEPCHSRAGRERTVSQSLAPGDRGEWCHDPIPVGGGLIALFVRNRTRVSTEPY